MIGYILHLCPHVSAQAHSSMLTLTALRNGYSLRYRQQKTKKKIFNVRFAITGSKFRWSMNGNAVQRSK